MAKLGIYSFFWDCNRQGEVEGMFIASEQVVAKAIGQTVCFGEILGKHSDVYGTLETTDLALLTEDQEFIQKFIEIICPAGDPDGKSGTTISGYNPLEFI